MDYSPFNPRNKSFTEKDILGILCKHNCPHIIQDVNLFQNAMIHSSYVKRIEYTNPQGEKTILAPKPSGCLDLFPESYERLEHLGDSILGAIVATYLSKRFPTQQEGFLTNLRKELVCNSMLGVLTQKIGLDDFYVISKHNEDTCAGRSNTKKLGDILEAFIGALWTDSRNDFKITYAFVISLVETYIDIPRILQNDTNFKDQLQKYCQTFLKYTPVYKMISSINGYTMIALGQDKEIGRGFSSTKKQGEQLAAQDALKKLKE
jgi:ribonuclease-3